VLVNHFFNDSKKIFDSSTNQVEFDCKKHRENKTFTCHAKWKKTTPPKKTKNNIFKSKSI